MRSLSRGKKERERERDGKKKEKRRRKEKKGSSIRFFYKMTFPCPGNERRE